MSNYRARKHPSIRLSDTSIFYLCRSYLSVCLTHSLFDIYLTNISLSVCLSVMILHSCSKTWMSICLFQAEAVHASISVWVLVRLVLLPRGSVTFSRTVLLKSLSIPSINRVCVYWSGLVGGAGRLHSQSHTTPLKSKILAHLLPQCPVSQISVRPNTCLWLFSTVEQASITTLKNIISTF